MASVNEKMGKELKTTSGGAQKRLMSELKSLQEEKFCNIELKDNNIMRWSIGLMVVNPESYYDGGYFLVEMTFPDTYPYQPPTFKFIRSIYHPNIYVDGKLCISILHAPGEDQMSGELASERWSSLQGVESVLRSALLLFDDPNISSPANVDAGIMYRNNREAFIQRAKKDVEVSKKDIPAGFVMPTTLIVVPPVQEMHDDEFWQESDGEDDFGGSDSSDEDGGDQEFEDDTDEDASGDQDEDVLEDQDE